MVLLDIKNEIFFFLICFGRTLWDGWMDGEGSYLYFLLVYMFFVGKQQSVM